MARSRRVWVPHPPERTYLYRKHGITQKEWWELFNNQKGACFVCGRTDTPLQVDHDHKIAGNREKDPKVKKAAIRGLLCWTHNRALQAFRDIAAHMFMAAEYVLRPPAWLLWPDEERVAV